MTPNFTTDNIDCLQANPLEAPHGWEITFRSTNGSMHHQLYLNGQLADWTDTTDQRKFLLETDSAPREVFIVAVDADCRAVDISKYLSPSLSRPNWTYQASVVRSTGHRPGDRLLLLGDHATGEMDSAPLMVRELCPAWAVRWAWGQGAFGLGGFGYGGLDAPGLGRGAFGAGLFGIGADVVSIVAALEEEGTHQLVLRTVDSEGQFTDSQIQTVAASPPPESPASVTITDYDSQNNTLTLQVE